LFGPSFPLFFVRGFAFVQQSSFVFGTIEFDFFPPSPAIALGPFCSKMIPLQLRLLATPEEAVPLVSSLPNGEFSASAWIFPLRGRSFQHDFSSFFLGDLPAFIFVTMQIGTSFQNSP